MRARVRSAAGRSADSDGAVSTTIMRGQERRARRVRGIAHATCGPGAVAHAKMDTQMRAEQKGNTLVAQRRCCDGQDDADTAAEDGARMPRFPR